MQEVLDVVNGPWWSKMIVYWLENQLAITFRSDLPLSAGKATIIDSLHLDTLNRFLSMRGYKLESFQREDVSYVKDEPLPQNEKLERRIEALQEELDALKGMGYDDAYGDSYQSPRERAIEELEAHISALQQELDNLEQGTASEQGDNDINSPIGKYLFLPASGQGTLVTCFFKIETTVAYAMFGTSPMGSAILTHESAVNNGARVSDMTQDVVNVLNENREALKRDAGIPIVAASPNWIAGGAPVGGGCLTYGCPMFPPIPVSENAGSAWHVALPELAPVLQNRTGAGVTVFVLDTRPTLTQITEASNRAGEHNELLQTLVAQVSAPVPLVKFPHQEFSLPDILENGHPQQPITGRDIRGRLTGFNMQDHGIFIAGLIRDVAPQATIEMVRTLNDFGVGTLSVLMEALEAIQQRMLPLNPQTGQQGDLYNAPVVINLSKVIFPAQEIMVQLWSGSSFSVLVQETDITRPLTAGLHTALQGLTSLGALVVGSAGNDSDTRHCTPPGQPKKMVIATERMRPRYPAAFQEVLSVGAVDQHGYATTYSNCPVPEGSLQHNGIATFGGEIPMPIFPSTNTVTEVDLEQIEALVGIYTSPTYPALSADDQPTEYEAPNTHAWAYWSGTSFATAIISAVAARVFEELTTSESTSNWQPYQWREEAMRAFTHAQGQQRWLTGDGPLPLENEFTCEASSGVGVLTAKQQSSLSTHAHSAPRQTTASF